MTYKLEPGLSLITSPVRLIFPNHTVCDFSSGIEVVEAVFDQRYRVTEIRAVENVVEVILSHAEVLEVNWPGEESTFF